MSDWRKFFLVTVIFLAVCFFWLATHKYSEEVVVAGNGFFELNKVTSTNSSVSSTATKEGEPSSGRKELLLPPKVVDGIKKFVFFVGYGRSRHTIISALLNAHPHNYSHCR